MTVTPGKNGGVEHGCYGQWSVASTKVNIPPVTKWFCL